MSVSTATLALKTPSLFVQKFGRLPTFDEAREIAMQFASLAAALNVGVFNLALNKGPAPEIPDDWKAAQNILAADIEGTLTEETVTAHFQASPNHGLAAVERMAELSGDVAKNFSPGEYVTNAPVGKPSKS